MSEGFDLISKAILDIANQTKNQIQYHLKDYSLNLTIKLFFKEINRIKDETIADNIKEKYKIIYEKYCDILEECSVIINQDINLVIIHPENIFEIVYT